MFWSENPLTMDVNELSRGSLWDIHTYALECDFFELQVWIGFLAEN